MKREIQIFIQFSQYWAFGGSSYDQTIDDNNGLIGVIGPEGLKIIAGTSMGPLTVTVETLDTPPPLVTQTWDVVGEADLTVIGDQITVAGWDEPTPAIRRESCFPTSRGLHRVRVHVRGRDIAAAHHVLDDPLEHHLIQAWPTPNPSRPVIHTDLDRIGRSMARQP